MSDMLQLVVRIGNSQCATLRVVSLLECCESRRQAEACRTFGLRFFNRRSFTDIQTGASDHIVACLGPRIQLKAITIASLDLIDEFELFVVFKTHAQRLRVFLNQRLIAESDYRRRLFPNHSR